MTNLESEMVPRNMQDEGSDIVWSGEAWICSRELKHYPAISRNGETISLYSIVYVMGEGEEVPYVAYLDDLYEDKKGHKKGKVRWFYHYPQVKKFLPNLKSHPEEVFITPHEKVISAECIDGVALVLTPQDYEKYLSLHPHGSSSSGVHMCHREFRNNKINLFSLSKIRGYTNNSEDQKATSSMGKQRDQIKKSELTLTHQKLRIKLSSEGSAIGIRLVGPVKQCRRVTFKVGDNVELLCQDSGIRGCWFRCKILEALPKRLKVEYNDINDPEGPGKLTEWIPESRVADPDKMGMRHAGRLTMRPWPIEDSSDYSVQIGLAVDVWWSDGWWEGVIIGVNVSAKESIQVYFPGENMMLPFEMINTRISRDWIDHRWVEIKVHADIFSSLSSVLGEETKLPASLHSALRDGKIRSSLGVGISEESRGGD